MFVNTIWPKTFRMISIFYDYSQSDFPGRSGVLILLQAIVTACSAACGCWIMFVLNPSNMRMIRFADPPSGSSSDGSLLPYEEQRLLYTFSSLCKALLAWTFLTQV